eukprot:1159416-Pelagomonas_calceolata.AAC.8
MVCGAKDLTKKGTFDVAVPLKSLLASDPDLKQSAEIFAEGPEPKGPFGFTQVFAAQPDAWLTCQTEPPSYKKKKPVTKKASLLPPLHWALYQAGGIEGIETKSLYYLSTDNKIFLIDCYSILCLCLSGHSLRVENQRHHGNRCPYELKICNKYDWNTQYSGCTK